MKPRLQVVHTDHDIKAWWLLPENRPFGRNTRFYHPDCEIWLVGRDSDAVGTLIMCNLQECHMPVSALRRNKK